MRDFLSEHRALILKRARAYLRQTGDAISAEDIRTEIELVLLRLHEDEQVTSEGIPCLDAYLRRIVKHAAGRAKRRRKLVQQVAAGDDLHAVSEDLAALDRDLPDPPSPLSDEASAARAKLDAIKRDLSPRDALVFSLLIEDDATTDEVARTLGTLKTDIEEALQRILAATGTVDVTPLETHAERAP